MRAQVILDVMQAGFLALSALLCVSLPLCYWLRLDFCAAVTFLPAWIWLSPGLILATAGWSRTRKRVVAGVVLLWVVYVVVSAEEARSLMRLRPWPAPGWEQARDRGEALRVISVNCSGGDLAAAEEVAPYHPDIVMLQETPERSQVKKLARRLFGMEAGVGRGVDTDIIARGTVTARPRRGLPPYAFVQARVRLTSGIEAEVFSAHFLPPVIRFDVWSPSCRREQTEKRRVHRQQMQEIAEVMAALPATMPIIIGGDFNVPGGDGVFRLLEPRLHDTFKEGGIGWGDTVLNDMPVSRFDQIWASKHLRAVAVVARETRYSDHRMVICDLVISRRANAARGPSRSMGTP